LRWPFRPFQVTCVLVAVLLTAAFSLELSLAEHAEGQPIPDEPTLSSFSRHSLGGESLSRHSLDHDSLGARLSAETIAIVLGNPKATSLTVARALSDAAAAGGHFRVLPLVDKDAFGRRISGGAHGQAGEQERSAIGCSRTFSIGRRVSANETGAQARMKKETQAINL
jgi:hypothetical protein